MYVAILNFNPRSPCGERPGFRINWGASDEISIHAPRAGSDVPCSDVKRAFADFNPRSPCGERHEYKEIMKDSLEFQSTLPVRGATEYVGEMDGEKDISIHAPRAGSDNVRNVHSAHFLQNFNPRSPCGERLFLLCPFSGLLIISIHAPRAGSDAGIVDNVSFKRSFQSTLPVRGATPVCRYYIAVKLFQSTLPVRGAT